MLLAAALGHTDVCNALLLRDAEVNVADSVSDILGNEFVLIYEDRDQCFLSFFLSYLFVLLQ